MAISYDHLRSRLSIDDIDLANANGPASPRVFESLNRDERWDVMGDHNNQFEIGGRSTDVSQLAMSVRMLVEDFYGDPPPPDVAQHLAALTGVANCTEHIIMRLLDGMAAAVIARRPTHRTEQANG